MTKKCTRCGETKPATTQYFSQRKTRLDSWCKECYAAKTREWSALNHEQKIERGRAYHAKTKEERREWNRLRAAEYNARPEVKALKKAYHQDWKMRAINAYGGPQCQCCGEVGVEFLTLDHINNDGNKHRRSLGGRMAGSRFYKLLASQGYPEGLRVLCISCNWGRHWTLTKQCPHEIMRQELTGMIPGSTACQAV